MEWRGDVPGGGIVLQLAETMKCAMPDAQVGGVRGEDYWYCSNWEMDGVTVEVWEMKEMEVEWMFICTMLLNY